ncbi:MAG: DNA translocase FtsK 4TM domain-containing protein [Clostridia bacterium]|nr:DNA translocase FtsK 4TM domain-containing protein [Clostridia bacterium]
MTENNTGNDRNINTNNEAPKTEKRPTQIPIPTGFARGVPILLFALAIFLTLCFMTQGTGAVGKLISGLLLGFFSYAAYALPLLIALHGVFYYADLHHKRRMTRLIFSIITVVGISTLIYVIRYWGQELPFTFGKYFTDGKSGAGLIGSIVAYCLIKIIGPVGVVILTVAVLALYVTYFFGKGKNAFAILGLKLLTAIMTFFSFIEKRVLHIKKKGAEAKENKKNKAMKEIGEELSNDDYFAVDNGMQELSIPELGILEVKSRRSLEENPTLHERVYPKSAQKENAERSFRAAEEASYAQQSAQSAARADAEILNTPLRSERPAPESVIYDTPFKERNAPETPQAAYTPTVEDNADAVFTKEFDPFNIAMNESLASKRSSRAAEMENNAFKTEEDAIPSTPEEAERRLRAIEFEKKKKQMMEERERQMAERRQQFEAAKAAQEAAKEAAEQTRSEEHTEAQTPFAATTVTYAPEDAPEAPARTVTAEEQRKTVEFHEATPMSMNAGAPRVSEEMTARIEKAAPAAEPAPAPMQSYNPAPAPQYQQPPVQNPAYVPQNPYVQPSPYAPPAYGQAPAYTNPYPQNPYAPMGGYAQPAPYPPQNPYVQPNPYVQNPYQPAPAPAYAPPAYGTQYAGAQTQEPSLQVPADAPAQPRAMEFSFGEAPVTKEYNTARTEERTEQTAAQFKPFSPEPPITAERAENAAESLTVEREPIFSMPPEEAEADEPTPIPPEQQNPEVLEYRNRFTFLREEAAENINAPAVTEEDAAILDAEDEEDAPPFDNATDVSAAFNSFRERESAPAPSVLTKELRPDYSDYKLPSLELLTKGSDEVDEGVLAEIQERQEKLIDALASFNVTASIKGVDRGPRVTRYEVVPAKGIKSNAITNLFDDICMALAAKGVRMESIPERSAIGFEIPNKKPQTVRLRDLIESEEFLSKPSKTSVCIGKDVTGNPVFGDIAKMPHVLVAGATGMGKSVCINAILISMLYKARPDEVKLILVDPKKVEFNVYNGIPHLLIPVVTDPKQAAGALMWAVEQMEKRYDMIEKLCVRNIEAYNAKVKDDPSLGEPMPKIVIVIDELNDLMIQVRDPVENLIMSIAQKARAAGIHLIIGTQRPSVNVITGVIKANIPSRISCKVSASVDSRTILERAGAEKLLNNGDMLFHPVGLSDPIRVQGAFVTDGEVEAVMEFLKKQNKGNSYDEQAIEDINRAAKKCSKKKDSDDMDDEDGESGGEGYLNDQKFLDAVDVAIKNQKIATSLIQRKLSIGYGKAAKYIDVMESLGIVGEANGPKPREVLITMDEWHEMLARRDLD